MNKMMQKAFSLVLVLAMAVTLAGCATDKDQLIGEWVGTVDYAEMVDESLKEGLGDELADYFEISEFVITVNLEFKEDGTYTMEMDEDALEDTFDTFRSDLEDGLVSYFEELLKDEGLDMSVEELLEQENTTMDELMDEIFTDDAMDMLLEEFEEVVSSKGNFDAEDGKLYTTAKKSEDIDEDLYEEYELDGDTMTLLSTTHDIEKEAEDLYPIEFERVG